MRSFPGKTILSVALATLALAACENGVDLGDLDDIQLEVLEGDAQNGTVGAALADSVVVRVEDGTGAALPNMTVTFRVLSGGGSVQPTSAVTDGQGIARAAWTLGSTIGQPQLLEVATAFGASTAADTLQATARAGAPAAIAPVGSSTRAGPAGAPVDSLAARVTDSFGNPVAGTAVVWTVRSGGGTISPQTATTDASGVAKAQWTLGLRVDSVQVAEAAAGLTLRTEFTATTSFPAGAQLVKTGGDNQTGTTGQLLPQPLEVTVRLPDGRGIRGVTVSWSTTSGTLTPAVDSTDAAGKSTSEWRLGTGTTGTKRATATVPGLGSVEFTATIPAAPPFTFVPEGGDGQRAPVNTTLPQPLVVRVIDGAGRRVEGATVTWTVLSGGGSVTATSVTDSEGLARATWTLGPVAGQQRVSASMPQNTAPYVFTATAVGTISVTINEIAGQFVGDTLRISGTVSSARPVASVVASVEGRTANMTVSGGTWSGTLVLTGLPTGTKELVVTATDVDGNQAEARRQFRFDPAPRLVISSPLGQTVARPSVQLTAQCLDDSPSTCRVVVEPGGSAFGTLNTSVTLSGNGLVVMNGVATDAAGQEDRETTVVWVESSPRVQEVYTIPVAGRVCDVAGDSVLYEDESAGSYQQLQRSVFYNGPVAVRLRTASGVQTVYTETGSGSVVTLPCNDNVLVPTGALVPSEDGTVHEIRNGTVTTAGTYNGRVGPERNPVAEEGGWAIWRNGSTLYRREPSTGVVTPIAANLATRAGQSEADVGANGDAVYENTTGQIVRVRGAVATVVSGAATTARDPVTDGVNTVWHEPVAGGQWRIMADTGGLGGPVVLSGPEVRTEPLVGRDYLAENGTIAFTRLGPTDQTEVWAVSPGTAPRQVSSPSSGSAYVAAVGPGGQVVYTAAGEGNYLDPGTGAADIDIGSGYQARRVLFRDGQLYVLLGRTVFRVVL